MSKYGPTVWPDDTPAPADSRSDELEKIVITYADKFIQIVKDAVLAIDEGHRPPDLPNGLTLLQTLQNYCRRRELESQLQLLGNLGYDKRLDDPILFCKGNEAYPREQRLQELQTELDKLTEGRGE